MVDRPALHRQAGEVPDDQKSGDRVNPVRNSNGASNPAVIILGPNRAAEQKGIISNGVKGLNIEASQ